MGTWWGWLLRRLVLAPLMPVLAVVAVALWVLGVIVSLVGCPVAALVRHRRVRWRPVRVLSMAVVYLVGETVCLVVCLVLWCACGCGRRMRSAWSQRCHDALLTRFLGALLAVAGRLFGFRLEVDEPDRHPEDLLRVDHEEPVIVLARHAGPGASFALVHLLLSRYRRHVKVVLKEQLRLDPAVDLLLTRTGCTWVGSARGQAARVGAAAAGLQPRDALLLFPEGADWTPVRHLRAVARLHAKGLVREAQRALAMPHVLPPRPAGTVAALRAAPHADVLVFTHTGHDALLDVRSAWQALPLLEPLRMAWWRAVGTELPDADADEVNAWLQQTWVDIEAWVSEQTDLSGLRAQRSRSPR